MKARLRLSGRNRLRDLIIFIPTLKERNMKFEIFKVTQKCDKY